MNLIIVESPSKAKTISKFVGSNFVIESSYGHVRDLPEKKLGIDIKKDFEPEYTILPKAKKRVAELRAVSKKAEKVILATDGDREGEAIAWHLIQALGLNEIKNQPSTSRAQVEGKSKVKIERIIFHEITKGAIEEALKNPRAIDLKLVDAQQARRILDRLVGYELSPFLWRKVARGLSAGRVQSVAVRLVVEREREILNFKPEIYFSITAIFSIDDQEFEVRLVKIKDKSVGKLDLKDEKQVNDILAVLKDSEFVIEKILTRELKRSPLPPFTTSTLQQAAFQKFRWSAKQTMVIAQQLYEGIEMGEEDHTGLITYMRTDSVNMSNEAVQAAKTKIISSFGPEYALENPRIFKTKTKSAQEAHEAIRPTDPSRAPETVKSYLDPRQFRLYELIWRRFLATQMKEALFSSTVADIRADDYLMRANGLQLKFDGFLKVYPLKTEENLLPTLKEKQKLEPKKIDAQKHQTEPPARFNEATLIKTLEEFGIGRPSTYAPTMTTIQERRYVQRDEQKRLEPTDIGMLVNDLLVEHFPKIVDVQFTARMEDDLDQIAQGEKQWVPIVKDFWEPFKENLDRKYKELTKKEITTEKTDKICPECQEGEVLIRTGRFGRFYACSRYPECKYTAPLAENDKPINQRFGPCQKCTGGEIVKRRTKKGRYFYGCSKWPECDFASWKKPESEKATE